MDDAIQGSKMSALQDRGVGCNSFLIWLPRWLSGEESACQCRSCRRHGFDPRGRKIPWRRKWQPTPLCLPGESHGQRSLRAAARRVTESAGTSPRSSGSHPPFPPPDVSAAPPAGKGPNDWARKGLRKLGLARGFQEGRQGHGQPAGGGA